MHIFGNTDKKLSDLNVVFIHVYFVITRSWEMSLSNVNVPNMKHSNVCTQSQRVTSQTSSSYWQNAMDPGKRKAKRKYEDEHRMFFA